MQNTRQTVCSRALEVRGSGVDSVRLDVGGIDFDADALAYQIDGQDEPGMCTFADETADDTFERAVLHFDHHALTNQRARVVLEVTFEETPNAVDFVFGDRRRLTFERNDVHDAGALQNRQRLLFLEACEAVAGKERPIDLFLAIFPAAPARDG